MHVVPNRSEGIGLYPKIYFRREADAAARCAYLPQPVSEQDTLPRTKPAIEVLSLIFDLKFTHFPLSLQTRLEIYERLRIFLPHSIFTTSLIREV